MVWPGLTSRKVPEVRGALARCKVQGRFRRFQGGLVQVCGLGEVKEGLGGSRLRRVRFKEGSGGFAVVWCRRKVQGRFRRFRGGLVQA